MTIDAKPEAIARVATISRQLADDIVAGTVIPGKVHLAKQSGVPHCALGHLFSRLGVLGDGEDGRYVGYLERALDVYLGDVGFSGKIRDIYIANDSEFSGVEEVAAALRALAYAVENLQPRDETPPA